MNKFILPVRCSVVTKTHIVTTKLNICLVAIICTICAIRVCLGYPYLYEDGMSLYAATLGFITIIGAVFFVCGAVFALILCGIEVIIKVSTAISNIIKWVDTHIPEIGCIEDEKV
jgi:hypothetical protein